MGWWEKKNSVRKRPLVIEKIRIQQKRKIALTYPNDTVIWVW
jgi:hypothetical protein